MDRKETRRDAKLAMEASIHAIQEQVAILLAIGTMPEEIDERMRPLFVSMIDGHRETWETVRDALTRDEVERWLPPEPPG